MFGCAGPSSLRGPFSCCGKRGLLSSCGARPPRGAGFSCRGGGVPGARASAVVAGGLSSCGSWALEHRLNGCGTRGWLAEPQNMGSSWIRDKTHVSCTGRQMLHHWATREAQYIFIIMIFFPKRAYTSVLTFLLGNSFVAIVVVNNILT